ncbi:hypothetical protein [Streptomyces sp. NPDC003278]|uniref:hypothetical protein n=1 Tax=Streptomyces sp. NPDC003278 TaxID=3364679 RepID=UPI0036A981ED
MSTLILPVRVTVGGMSANVGTVEIDAAEQVGPQIADMLRAVADVYERAAEEVTSDAPARR